MWPAQSANIQINHTFDYLNPQIGLLVPKMQFCSYSEIWWQVITESYIIKVKPPKKSGKETTARKILETVKACLLKIKAKHFHCVGVGNVPIQQPQHPYARTLDLRWTWLETWQKRTPWRLATSPHPSMSGFLIELGRLPKPGPRNH